MNKVVLLGYISQDPKGKEIPEKNLVMSRFSVAVSDMRNYNQTFFFNCVAWNQTAEYINNNLKKGNFVIIDGRLTNRSYVNESGMKMFYTEVNVDSIKNLGTKKDKIDTNNSTNVVDIDDMLNYKNTTELVNEMENVSLDNDNNSSNNDIGTVDWDDDLE